MLRGENPDRGRPTQREGIEHRSTEPKVAGSSPAGCSRREIVYPAPGAESERWSDGTGAKTIDADSCAGAAPGGCSAESPPMPDRRTD